MFCSNCGNALPDNLKFCPNCGYNLLNRTQEQQTNQWQQPNQRQQANQGTQNQYLAEIPFAQRPWTKFLWGIPGILMPFAGFIIAIVMLVLKRKMDALVSVAGALIGMLVYLLLF